MTYCVDKGNAFLLSEDLIAPNHIHCVAVAHLVSVEKRPFRAEIGEVKGFVKDLEMLHFTHLVFGGDKAALAAADI